jgi:hypothetical protein
MKIEEKVRERGVHTYILFIFLYKGIKAFVVHNIHNAHVMIHIFEEYIMGNRQCHVMFSNKICGY